MMSITTISVSRSVYLEKNEDITNAKHSYKPAYAHLTPDTSAANAVKDASNSKKSLFSRTVSWLKCIFDWTLYLTLSFATLGIYALVCKLYKTDKVINKQAQEIKALQEYMHLNGERNIALWNDLKGKNNELNDKFNAHEVQIKKLNEENSTFLSEGVKVNTSHLPEILATPQTNSEIQRIFARRNSSSSPLTHTPHSKSAYNCCEETMSSASSNYYTPPLYRATSAKI